MEEALKFAESEKTWPQIVMWGQDSKFCIDFLFNHFARKAPQHYKDQCDESKWKKSISKNLAVFEDSIGLMKCEPYSFKLKEGCSPSYRKPYLPTEPEQETGTGQHLEGVASEQVH